MDVLLRFHFWKRIFVWMGPKSKEKLKAMLMQNVWGKRENDEYAGIDRIAIILVARSSS